MKSIGKWIAAIVGVVLATVLTAVILFYLADLAGVELQG